MAIINCTPHPLTIIKADGSTISFPKGETVPRLSTTTAVVDTVEGVEVRKTSFGEVTGLPAAQPGVWLVVSRLVLDTCPDRQDLLAPGEAVRDTDGKVIGAKGFSR